MDYEKRFKEVLERARIWQKHLYDTNDRDYADELNYIFPELKENEDEKIRKAILNYFIKCWGNCKGDVYGMHVEDAIAWLEKQGEPYGQRKECLDCQFNYAGECKGFCPIKEMHKKHASNTKHNWYVSKVDGKIYDLNYVPEPKFKVGDWILNNVCFPIQIASVKDGMYIFTEGDAMSVPFVDENYYLWIIQDAKDGDVLAEDSCIFIIKTLNQDYSAKVYCCLHDDGDFEINSTLRFDDISTYPATKEQRDTLFAKMKENGYEWGAEKKELKKIEQKPAWSEEDEKNLLEIKCLIGSYRAGADEYRLDSWIDNFKNRVQPKQEWSKEDEKILDALVTSLNNEVFAGRLKTLKGIGVSSVIDWLKSLKQRIIG